MSAVATISLHSIGPAGSVRCWQLEEEPMSFKAAAVQMCSGVDPVKNAAAMARLVREAAAQGATYVQTPEMTGMLQRDRTAARAVLADEAHDIIVKTGSEL